MAKSVVTRTRLRKLGGMSIEGVDNLFDNLERIIDRTQAEKLKDGLMEVGRPVQQQVRAYAQPYNKTGKLDANIFVAPGKPDKADVLVGINFKNAPQGLWLEYGTSRQPAKPFFRPAIVSMRSATAQALVALFKRVIDEAIK